MPMAVLDWKSPHEVLFGRTPDYSSLRIMGCLCFASPWPKPHDKYESCGIKCIFLGYLQGQKAYKLYDLTSKRIFSSRDVIFYEDTFPYRSSSSTLCSIPNSFSHMNLDNSGMDLTFVHTDDVSIPASPLHSDQVLIPSNSLVLHRSSRETHPPRWLDD